MWRNPLFDRAAAPTMLDQIDEQWHEAITYLICLHAPWDHYEIRHINNAHHHFYLFIPKKLLSPSIADAFQLRRAMRYDAFPYVYDIAREIQNYPAIHHEVLQQVQYDQALYHTLEQLLIPKIGTSYDPVWTFYCMGHGTFCHDACEKINQQEQQRTKCLQERASCEREEVRWCNELIQWERKQQSPKEYDASRNGYIVYDQNAIQHNIEACRHNSEICKHNKEICDKNLEIIEHNKATFECSNTIAGISQQWFRKMIRLFDQRVKTNLLFYRSCSAGGQQLIDLFTDNKQPLRVSYTVIVGTLCEASSSTFSPVFQLTWYKNNAKNLFVRIPVEKLIDKQHHTVALDSRYNLESFFTQTHNHSQPHFDVQAFIETVNPVTRAQPSSINQAPSWFETIKNGFNTVMNTLFGSPEQHKEIEREDIANIPSIRLPNETQWYVIDLHNTILSITEKDIATYDPTFTIRAPFEIVMLCNPNINKTLLVTLRETGLFPAFISLIPGKAYHIIHHLDAQQYPLSTILSSFFVCSELRAPKLFLIKTLTCINDVLNQTRLGFVHSFSNVYLFNHITLTEKPVNTSDEYLNGILFDYNCSNYLITWPSSKPFPHTITIQTISMHYARSIVEQLSKQCYEHKQNDRPTEQAFAVISMQDLQKKISAIR